MGKRSIFIVFIALLIIGATFVGFKLFASNHNGFDIEIRNACGKDISGLAITYEGIAKDIELPEIAAGKIYKININPTENFSENSMIIYYKDKRGYVQKNTLIGYFEKGYNGKVEVTINSQDDNGLIIMRIEEKIK